MCAVSSPPVHKIIILFSFDGAHRARAAGRGLRLYCATHTPTRHTPIVIRWLCWKKNLLLEFHYGFIFNVKNFHFFFSFIFIFLLISSLTLLNFCIVTYECDLYFSLYTFRRRVDLYFYIQSQEAPATGVCDSGSGEHKSSARNEWRKREGAWSWVRVLHTFFALVTFLARLFFNLNCGMPLSKFLLCQLNF